MPQMRISKIQGFLLLSRGSFCCGFVLGFSIGLDRRCLRFGLLLRRLWWRLVGRIIVKNSPTGTTGDDVLVSANLFPGLRTQHHEACHAFLSSGFRNRGFTLPHHAIVVGQSAITDAPAQSIALL